MAAPHPVAVSGQIIPESMFFGVCGLIIIIITGNNNNIIITVYYRI